MSIRESIAGAAEGRNRRKKSVSGIRKGWKLIAGAAVLCTLLASGGIRSLAADYAYTVTFYPGNHGTFQGTGELSVNERNASNELVPIQNNGSWQIEQTSEYIRVTGLKAGQYVVFGDVNNAVKMDSDSRYYVRGIRVSGRDNSTVDVPAFPVEGDRDYVVAYGIAGDMTSYVVNYQDRSGNPLAPSRTYRGNVGDKPVIAFLYIEGYQPQAYNLTKTLSQNTAENVFTFTYVRRAVPAPGGGEEAAGTTQGGAGTTTPVNAGTQVGQTGTPGTPGTPDGGEGGDAQEPDVPDGNQGGEAQNPEENGSEENEPEESGPQDVVDLDEGDVPLAGPAESIDGAFRFPVWGSICITVAGTAAIGGILWFMLSRRKKEKVRDEES